MCILTTSVFTYPNMEEKALKLSTLEMLALFSLHLHIITSNKAKVMREFPAESLAKEYWLPTSLEKLRGELGRVLSCKRRSVTGNNNGCSWVFKPAYSSYIGVSCECMTGVSRWILKSMLQGLGPAELFHEVYITFMAEVTAIVNALPWNLCQQIQMLHLFWHQQFCLLRSFCSSSPAKQIQWKRPLQSSVEASLDNTFWHRWRQEYLSTLQSSWKWQNESSEWAI